MFAHAASVFLKCILKAQRPIVACRAPGCELDVHADRGEMEGAGRAEQDSGWGGRGSLLISHNPPLCFGPTRELSLEQIHTSPTV